MQVKFKIIIIIIGLALLETLTKAWAEAPPVYVVDLRAATPQEKIITVSLQGLMNRDPQGAAVFTLTNSQDETWLAWDLQLSRRPTETVTPDQLLAKFRAQAKGQVLYSPDDPLSLNLATTLAGLRDGIVSDRDLGLVTIADLRGKFKTTLEAYQWAEKELLPQLPQAPVALLRKGTAMRDYIICRRLLALPLPAAGEREAWSFLGKKLGNRSPGTLIFSPPGESASPLLNDWANHFGYILTGGEDAANLSVHAKFTGVNFRPRPQYGELEGRIYVCFMFSGGDDLGAALGRTRTRWQEPARAGLPAGWALPPALAEVAPDVLQAYAGDAYRSRNDSFLLQIDRLTPGGDKALAAFSQEQAALGTKALVVTENSPSGENLLPALTRLADKLHPAGIFLPNTKDLPARLLGDTVLTNIGFSASRPEEIGRHLSSFSGQKGGLTFVWIDSNKITPGDVADIVSQLPDTFEVITPDEFLLLARRILVKRQRETASNVKFTLQTPPKITLETPLAVRGELSQPAAGPVLLLYRQGDGPEYFQPMARQADGSYQALLPPLLRGGNWILQARADQPDNKVAWSQELTISAPLADEDNDNLDRPEEMLLATDPNNPDTDGDGLLDGYDPNPFQVDTSRELYFGPLTMGEDRPYLVSPKPRPPQAAARTLQAGEALVYRLPVTGVPSGAPMELGLRLQGKGEVAFSADGRQFGKAVALTAGKTWDTAAVPAELAAKGGFYFRLTPGKATGEQVLLQSLALFSPFDAPSLASPVLVPPYPGPAAPFGISVDLWDPQGIKEAWGCYRSGKGIIKVGLQKDGNSPTWRAAMGEISASQPLDWWVTAENGLGRKSASRIQHQWVGNFGAENVSLTPGKELEGFWRWQGSGWGMARSAALAGVRDRAEFQVSGGNYSVWILTGGNREGAIWLDNNFFRQSRIKADGWQNLGEINLSAGSHSLEVVSGPGESGAIARYGQVLLTTARSFRPPSYGLMQTADSLVLFSPQPKAVIGPRTEVKATATGNISRVVFYVDGVVLKRLNTPPYDFIWDSGQLKEGRHLLQINGLSRAGQILSYLEIEVNFSRTNSP